MSVKTCFYELYRFFPFLSLYCAAAADVCSGGGGGAAVVVSGAAADVGSCGVADVDSSSESVGFSAGGSTLLQPAHIAGRFDILYQPVAVE